MAVLLGGCGGPLAAADRSLSHGAAAAPGEIPPVREVPVCGYHVQVIRGDGEFEGELIAVDEDRVLLVDDTGLVPLGPRYEFLVRVRWRTSVAGVLAAGTAVNALGTLTNGPFLVLTLPLVLGLNVPAAVAESRGAWLEPVSAGNPRVAQFARFPQGLPPGWPPAGQRVERCLPAPGEQARPRPGASQPSPPPVAAPPAAVPPG
jgi:hypothetical protein